MVIRLLLGSVLVLSCGGPDVPRASTPPEPEPIEASTEDEVVRAPDCSVFEGEGEEHWTFDAAGLPTTRLLVSHAAGTQHIERWERDAEGRTTRIVGEELEGMSEGSLDPRSVRMEVVDETSVRVHVGDRIVRWVYDERGYPIERGARYDDQDVSEERVTTCRYDERGRVVARDGVELTYEGLAPTSLRYGRDAQDIARVYDSLVIVQGPRFGPREQLQRWQGACHDVFVQPCSPVFAPPPPGRRRARVPHPAPLEPMSTPEDVARRHLGCDQPDFEADEPCAFEVLSRTEAEDDVPGAAILKLARGPQEQQSTHLAIARSDGWWAGPQLGDGPFNGNQMSGTFHFTTRDLQVRELAPGGGREILLRYDTTRAFTRDEEEHEVEERGYVVCISVTTAAMGCARVPERIQDTVDGRPLEASVSLGFPGDGTITVTNPVGSHPRVPARVIEIAYLFEP